MYTTDELIQHLIILCKQCYEMVKAFLKVAYERGKLYSVKEFSLGEIFCNAVEVCMLLGTCRI